MRRRLACAAALSGALGCTSPQPPAKLPPAPYIAVLSGQMPRPLDQVARHGWVVVQPARGRAHRYEYGGGGSHDGDPFDDFAAGDVMLHGVYRGTAAEIDAKDRCLAEAARAFHREYPTYFPIPGPNSNTFVAYVDRRCALGIELPATAIGRDYVGPIGADLTEGGTGILIGAFPLGLRIGLREGVGIHFFGLPLAVHLWPPGIDLPINPGRIGFAADGHTSRPVETADERPYPDHARAEGFQRRWIQERGVVRMRRVTSTAKNCACHKPVSATYPLWGQDLQSLGSGTATLMVGVGDNAFTVGERFGQVGGNGYQVSMTGGTLVFTTYVQGQSATGTYDVTFMDGTAAQGGFEASSCPSMGGCG